MWHCHMSTVNCQLSYVTCQLSRVNLNYRISTITCHIWTVNNHMSHVNCQQSHVTCQLSHFNYHMSHVNYHLSTVNCHVSSTKFFCYCKVCHKLYRFETIKYTDTFYSVSKEHKILYTTNKTVMFLGLHKSLYRYHVNLLYRTACS